MMKSAESLWPLVICTRQHYRRSCLPLPSPWLKLILPSFGYFVHWSCTEYFVIHWASSYTIDVFHPPHTDFLFSLLLQWFPALYLSPRIDVFSSRVRNIFIRASAEMYDLTFSKICVYIFICIDCAKLFTNFKSQFDFR